MQYFKINEASRKSIFFLSFTVTFTRTPGKTNHGFPIKLITFCLVFPTTQCLMSSQEIYSFVYQ